VLATARTFALLGIAARTVSVEVDVRGGLPTFTLVGLPDAAVRESRERVRAAIVNSGFEFPQQRITASLAPADMRKAGPAFDLAIAAALLAASGQIAPAALEDCALAGELALDGSVRPVPGALTMAEEARRRGVGRLGIAAASAREAALAAEPNGRPVPGLRIVPLERLRQLEALGTDAEPPPPAPLTLPEGERGAEREDLADLRGQPSLRSALEVAAAGGHGLLMLGPPGAGKSLAARCLPSIMPSLSRAEALEVIAVASACGQPVRGAARRPFRAPHHTISAAGLVGGGNPPRAGEATLAHRGVLFLDELGEFRRDALEALRQPLEEGRVLISRSRHAVELPCRFLLIAAANPCPCGRGEGSVDCTCDPARVRRYRARLSGALADRIDISLSLSQPSAGALAGPPGERSAVVRARVIAARERQRRRLGAGRCNAEMSPAECRAECGLDSEAAELLAAGYARLRLSGRGHDRVLRLARTLADLEGRDEVRGAHVTHALTLRRRAEE
jgi:magnesium chelatase family protein